IFIRRGLSWRTLITLNDNVDVIPEVNPVIPEPNQVVDVHDPNEMVDIPDDVDLVDYDLEEEDVEIEFDDDAELIFPYESSNSESEDEKVDVASEATVGTINQKPYATRTYRDVYLRWVNHLLLVTHLMIEGLASWALRRNLEASRARTREMDANEENAMLKKLVETEMKLELALMKCETANKRLHESQVWNTRFYLDMVLIGAVPKLPIMENTKRPRKILNKSSSSGTEKPSESHGIPSDSL
ncbi:hypothetical protein Tco_1065503, partial [Tanacetum coccineum]